MQQPGGGAQTSRIGKAEAARIKKLLETFSQKDVAAIVKRSPDAISLLKKRNFMVAGESRRRPAPMDWGLYCNRMTVSQLMAHYRANQRTVIRWISEKGRDFKGKPFRRDALPIPTDLPEKMAELKSNAKAAAHYGVGKTTIRKWRHMLGLPMQATWNRKSVSQFKWWERKVA